MFKNYLTYQFALSFHQLCLVSDIVDTNRKSRLLRSAEQMIQSFTKSLHANTPQDEGLHYFSTLMNLRECAESLEEAGLLFGEIRTKYQILHERLEKLCESASASEHGQIRMLG